MSGSTGTWRAAALVSGGGTTACNLIDRGVAGEIPARVVVVIAHRHDIPAIERCRAKGVEVVLIDGAPSERTSDEIDRALSERSIDLVLLAGYLRPFRVGRWRGRVLNIHPALLPDFGGKGMYGKRVHAAVLAAGRRESGCTVHLVDDQYDHGEPLVARRVRVEPGDTPESLGARVFEEECIAYPQAIRAWAARQDRARATVLPNQPT